MRIIITYHRRKLQAVDQNENATVGHNTPNECLAVSQT